MAETRRRAPGRSVSGTPAVTAHWVERAADGGWRVESWPPPPEPGDARRAHGRPRLALTNDRALARQALPPRVAAEALDIRDVFALAQPVATAEDLPEMLAGVLPAGAPVSGARALVEAWSVLAASFQAWPPAVRELVVQLLAAAGPAWAGLAGMLNAGAPLTLEGTTPVDAFQGFLAALRSGHERVVRRELPAHADCQPLDPDAIAAWLEPDGPCARGVEGYEHRPGQIAMLRAVTEAFNTERHLVVEAGTGIGKSVAYLLPGILWAVRNKLPVVVSTSTKNLQTQLFHKDIPLLRGVLDMPFRAALIKGRMNYVCLRHALHLLERREAELTAEEVPVMAKVVAWLVATSTGDLDELDRIAAEDGAALLARLPATSAECGGRRCRHYARCPLQRARARSLGADIVVANHALVFTEDGERPVAIPKHAQVVFDEAHNLEESATRHFSVEISSLRFALPLRRLWRGGGRRRDSGLLEDLRLQLHAGAFGIPAARTDLAFAQVAEAILAVDDTRRKARLWLAALATLPRAGEAPLRYTQADRASPRWQAQDGRLAELGAALQALHKALEELLSTLRPARAGEGARHADQADAEAPDRPAPGADALQDTTAAQLAVAALQSDLDFVTGGRDTDYVYWLDVTVRDREPLGALCAAPLDISARLAAEVFAVRRSVVLCSATLSVNGSFQFLGHRLGLDRIAPERLLTCQAVSPFDFARQCRVAAPLFLPDPAESGGGPYAQALAGFLAALLRRTRGRALVLFTSYDMLRTCARALAEPLRQAGIALLIQGEGGSRDRLTRIFRRDVSSVLLGTDSFWEGVDVMGESLSCVVIARLPFDAVKDPLCAARGERVGAEGGDPFRHFALPNAIIRFRQGFGRLIRHRADRGWVIVTDRRIQTRSYGLHFRRNLPCPVAPAPSADALLDAVAAFLAET